MFNDYSSFNFRFFVLYGERGRVPLISLAIFSVLGSGGNKTPDDGGGS